MRRRSFPFSYEGKTNKVGIGHIPNKQFSTDTPQRRRAKIRKWVPASYACYESFSSISTTTKSPNLPKRSKRKGSAACDGCNAFHCPVPFSLSTFKISLAAAMSIRNPCSLIIVQQRVELPPLRAFLCGFLWKKELDRQTPHNG